MLNLDIDRLNVCIGDTLYDVSEPLSISIVVTEIDNWGIRGLTFDSNVEYRMPWEYARKYARFDNGRGVETPEIQVSIPLNGALHVDDVKSPT